MENRLAQLFEKTRINGLALDNRIVRSATWEGMCTEDGRPTPQLNELYRRLARGGVGLITTGFAFVTADGKPLPGAMGLHRDDFNTELRDLTRTVHQEGGRICAQLGHAGGQTRSPLIGGQPLAPSAVAAPQYRPESPREMTPEDIARIGAAFAAAARRARDCGFDAVQLHAAHGYLFNQFLSPHTNRRRDNYGGDWRQRSRFFLETLVQVREAVGRDYPVMVKLNGSDNLDGGLFLDEAVLIAEALDQAGIDAIEVSAGTPASGDRNPLRTGIVSPEKESYNLQLSRTIKQAVACPVITVGGIRSYWTARGIIRRGDSDYISLCRPLIREPHLPSRWRRPDEGTLSQCISCNACFKTALKGSLSCVVTDALGRKESGDEA